MATATELGRVERPRSRSSLASSSAMGYERRVVGSVVRRGGLVRWGSALTLVSLLSSCAPAREVVLRELVNDQIDRTRIGLHHIAPRQIFRRGKRVTVDFASVLVLDAATKTIKTEVVSAGDEIWIGKQRWIVLRVEPRTAETAGQIVLTPAED